MQEQETDGRGAAALLLDAIELRDSDQLLVKLRWRSGVGTRVRNSQHKKAWKANWAAIARAAKGQLSTRQQQGLQKG